MATPSTTQQAAQQGLALLVQQDIEAAWSRLQPSNLKGSLPDFTVLMHSLVRKYGPVSGAMAGRFYQAARRAHGLPAGRPLVADPPPLDQVSTAVQWATSGLWADPTATEPARVKVDGAVTKLVQDVGRQTILGSVQADPKAKGWARVPEPGCCAFCALLATRGAVYKDQPTADFRSHDHCRCHAEPIFTAYEPSAQIRQWQADYTRATRGVSGARNQRLAWRQAFEGRTAP